MIKRKVHHGAFYSYSESNFRRKDGSGKFHWPLFWFAWCFGFIQFMCGIVYIYALNAALLAEINQGVITSLFTLNSVFSGIIFFFVYSEKLKLYIIFGMLLLTSCAICISLKPEAISNSIEPVFGEEITTKVMSLSSQF